MCSERLQIAPDSATRIDTENLIPLCQKCGITVAKRLEAVGHPLDVLATRNMLPKLARKFDSGDETAAFISGHELHCAHCRALLSIADAAAHVCPEPKR
jgi:5-methylcytosine-specific restriction endonuclease McrA